MLFEVDTHYGMVTPVDISRDQDQASLLVRVCSPGEIRVNAQRFHTHLLLSPTQARPDWPVSDPSHLTPADFEATFAMQPDLIILGTGDRLVFPAAEVSAAILGRGIGFEVMDTRAACRTYNLLAMDRRSVVAALMQLSSA